MKIKAYHRFKKCYDNLPAQIKKKVDNKIRLLSLNLHHSSLHTKKIKGCKGIWEVRIDIKYRMTFEIIGETIFLRVVGNHDEVLRRP